MEIQPILKSLRRQKTAALLIAFEIALACAIICNTLFVISERMDRMHIDSGVAESELVRIRSSTLDDAAERSVRTAEDLAALQTVAGVVEVAAVQQVPFGNSSWNSGLSVERGAPPVTGATNYFDSGNLVSTLGLRLTAGRDFRPDEYIEFDATVPPKGVLERTGIALNAGKLVVVYASSGDTSVNVYGLETAI